MRWKLLYNITVAIEQWGKIKDFNIIYRISIISRFTWGDLQVSKTKKLVRDCLVLFDSSSLWSVSLRSAFNGFMFGLNFYRQKWKATLKFASCKRPNTESLYISIQTTLFKTVTMAKSSQISQHSSALITCISTSGSDIKKIVTDIWLPDMHIYLLKLG